MHYIHYIQTCIHELCIHECMHTCTHACMHTCIYAYTHTWVRACVHACIHACMHSCMRACIYAHAYMHTCILLYAYTIPCLNEGAWEPKLHVGVMVAVLESNQESYGRGMALGHCYYRCCDYYCHLYCSYRRGRAYPPGPRAQRRVEGMRAHFF